MKKILLVAYNFLVLAALAVVLIYTSGIPGFAFSEKLSPGFFIIFTVLASITECWVIKMPGYGLIPTADIFYYVIMATMGPVFVGIISIISNTVKALHEIFVKKQGIELHLFNIIQVPLTFILGALILHSLGNPDLFFEDLSSSVINAVSLLTVSIFCVVFRSTLNTIHRHLGGEIPIVYIIQLSGKRVFAYLATIPTIAMLVIAIYQVSPPALLLLALPLALVYSSIKRYTDLLGEAKSTLETLAEYIEARDPYMVDHAERVSHYAMEIGKKMNLPPEMLEHLESAARLHDLGKVSIADDILVKLETLSEDEFEAIKKHPGLGGDVAGRLSFCREESPMIRHHHEHYDGSGYPEGLKEEEIPLGARIIALAEAFDVMTTARAYRNAMSFGEAFEEIKKGKGSQFDPRVVEAFSHVIKQRINKFD